MSDAVRALKDKGAQLFAKGRHDAALDCFEKALLQVPSDMAARQKAAELCQRVGKPREAVRHYELLAVGLAKSGLLLRAIAACKMLLELDPGHGRTQGLLADLYAQRRAPSPAAAAMTPAARPSPGPTAVSPVQLALPAAPHAKDRTDDGSVEIELDEEVAGDEPRRASGTAGLAPIPLFSGLERDAFVAVLEGMEVRLFEPGAPVVTEGEVGTSMFAIVEGSVDVVRHFEAGERRAVAEMGEGDFFGEMALLTDAPRLASVVAKVPCLLLEFTRARMEAIVSRHPAVGEVMQTFYRERLLANVLRSNPLFAALPEDVRQALADAFRLRQAAAGELLVEHGQTPEGFHLLLRGSCSAFHPGEAGEVPYPPLREGDVFGEISLLLGGQATASVRAESSCSLLVLPREGFERLVGSDPALRAKLSMLGMERLARTAKLAATSPANHLRV